jgi:ribosomal protein S4
LDPFNVGKGLIRMSWDKQNLYNLVHVKQPPESFNLRKTVFQQKWIAKRELRAYHNPLISEKQFLARHFKTKINLQHLSKADAEKVPPIQAVGFGAELEKRVDVIVFRSHFASSIWEARRLVVDGHVSVNGEKVEYIITHSSVFILVDNWKQVICYQ